jgi:hypothetical protein
MYQLSYGQIPRSSTIPEIGGPALRAFTAEVLVYRRARADGLKWPVVWQAKRLASSVLRTKQFVTAPGEKKVLAPVRRTVPQSEIAFIKGS